MDSSDFFDDGTSGSGWPPDVLTSDSTHGGLGRFGIIVRIGGLDEKRVKYDPFGAVAMWPKRKGSPKTPRAQTRFNQVRKIRPERRERNR